MAQIPAKCGNCEFLFPSPLQVLPGLTLRGNRTKCPRCGSPAAILDGYTAIIDGLVAFIISPDYTIEEKRFLIGTAKAVAKGEIKAAVAERQLTAKNTESARLFREWSTWGMTFLATIAAVGSFLISYADSRGNSPLADVAIEKFEEILAVENQTNKASNLAPHHSVRPNLKSLGVDPNLKNHVGATANANTPNENRKARRARIKKDRTKSRK